MILEGTGIEKLKAIVFIHFIVEQQALLEMQLTECSIEMLPNLCLRQRLCHTIKILKPNPVSCFINISESDSTQLPLIGDIIYINYCP